MKPVLTSVVLCFLAFLSVAPLHAQMKDAFKGELYLGAGGGALFSKVDFIPGVPQVFKQGLSGGIAAKYVSEKHLGLILELNIAQRGWKEAYDVTDFSYRRSLTYLEIPFMTHVYAGGKTRFIVNAGPQISLLLGENEVMSKALSDDVNARRAAAKPEERIGMQYKGMYDLKRIDYGLIGGVGMEFKTGIGDFDLEGRYYFGLGDIFTNRRSVKAFFSRSAARLIEAKLTYYVKLF